MHWATSTCCCSSLHSAARININNPPCCVAARTKALASSLPSLPRTHLVICVAEDCHRPHAHPSRCPHDSACNLASVCDQYLIERAIVGTSKACRIECCSGGRGTGCCPRCYPSYQATSRVSYLENSGGDPRQSPAGYSQHLPCNAERRLPCFGG